MGAAQLFKEAYAAVWKRKTVIRTEIYRTCEDVKNTKAQKKRRVSVFFSGLKYIV